MKGKIFSTCVIVLLALCSIAWAADVNGKWITNVAGTQGQQDYEITLTFKAEGTILTGTLNNSMMPGDIAVNDGKIEGDNISFSIIRNIGQGDMKVIWKGIASGDEIRFTRTVEGGMGGQGGAGATPEIIAKRAK